MIVLTEKKPVKEKRALFTLDFFISLTSFFLLLISSTVGSLAILGFLAPWIIVIARSPKRSISCLIDSWPLLLMPLLCLVSASWSREPIWTVKASLELAATMIVGIWSASLIKPRMLISGILSALILIGILCVAFGVKTGATGVGGRIALQGIYESKNAFSAVMCLLLLIALSVVADKGQSLIIRLLAACAVIAAPILLYLGQSVGAIFAVFGTLIIFRLGRYLSNFGQSSRTLIYTLLILVTLAAVIPLSVIQLNPLTILSAVGKDPTLTGRTHLWERAADVIEENPVQGIGYRAFWRIGNPVAEELWFYGHVQSGAGFNFHNEYVEMLVELGALGFMLAIAYFIVIAKRVAQALLTKPRVEQTFASLSFILLMLRTPLEVEIFDQFNIGIILLCLSWIYLRPNFLKGSIKQTTNQFGIVDVPKNNHKHLLRSNLHTAEVASNE